MSVRFSFCFFSSLPHNKSDNETNKTKNETSNCPESVVIRPFIGHSGIEVEEVFAEKFAHGHSPHKER